MKTKGKIITACCGIIICLTLIIFISFVSSISSSTEDPMGEEIRVEIEYGSSTAKIAQVLKENNIIKNEKIFYYCVRYPQLMKILFEDEEIPENINLKSGVYFLKQGTSIPKVINKLCKGSNEYIKISIPEGLTITQIGYILEDNNICTKDEFKKSCKKRSIIDKYNIPEDTVEGYLFPDTYFLTKGMTSDDVVLFMLKNFYQKIESVPGLTEKTPEELNDIVILASIVEREYRLEEEAPLIASVFSNRLRNGIGLYSCATIIYILTEIQGKDHPDRVLLEDTKIDNPYNTYLWSGLTPGPISNPGLISLNAAANPPKTNYYFFQVADVEEGRHVFTSTFDEHKASHNLTASK